MRALPVLIAAVALTWSLLLVSCEEETDPKEAEVQQEVSRRVEALRVEMKDDQDRRATIRVVVFSLLAAGSVVCLLHFRAEDRWFQPPAIGGDELPRLPEPRPPERPGYRRIEQPGGHREPDP